MRYDTRLEQLETDVRRVKRLLVAATCLPLLVMFLTAASARNESPRQDKETPGKSKDAVFRGDIIIINDRGERISITRNGVIKVAEGKPLTIQGDVIVHGNLTVKGDTNLAGGEVAVAMRAGFPGIVIGKKWAGGTHPMVEMYADKFSRGVVIIRDKDGKAGPP